MTFKFDPSHPVTTAPQVDVAQVVEELNRSGLCVATAESLTAGLLGSTLADVPGASKILAGGVIAYRNSVKNQVLGVSNRLLDKVGAVDAEVAQAMARGAKNLLKADIGISTTGVAGPLEHQGKPVGTVWIGYSGPDGDTAVLCQFAGDRHQIRQESVHTALHYLLVSLSMAP